MMVASAAAELSLQCCFTGQRICVRCCSWISCGASCRGCSSVAGGTSNTLRQDAAGGPFNFV
jgi:hypothetical protein